MRVRCDSLTSVGRPGPAMGVLLALLLAACMGCLSATPSLACSEQPLTANIGHALVSSPASWSTATSRTVNAGQTVYFHALSSGNSGITNYYDVDLVGGQCKQDDAYYKWDWCYDTGEDANGLAPSKTYYWPGNRTVRLRVYDGDGAGFTDDVDRVDVMTVKVPLTLETDWMNGYAIIESGVDENGAAMTLASEYARAGHTLTIDPNHQTSCDDYPYIGDAMTDTQIYSWLNGYENRGCHMYLLGARQYKATHDPAGMYFYATLGIVFMEASGGLTTTEKLSAEIHETAAHDSDVVYPDGLWNQKDAQGNPIHCGNDACALRTTVGRCHICNDCIEAIKDNIETYS